MKEYDDLDATDFNILSILLKNSRESYKQIGLQVGLSAPAVTERIRQMEDSGIIKGYTVDLDAQKIGYNVSAIITLTSTYHPLSKLIGDIMKEHGVYLCCRLTGDFDYMLFLMVESIGELDKALRQFSKYGKTKTNIVLAQEQKRDLPNFQDKI